MTNSINQMFVDAVFNKKTNYKNISVRFKGSDEFIGYTTQIWDLLVTDPTVDCIIDSETYEVLFPVFE